MITHAATLDVGKPEPLGATWDGGGVNFALFSETADRVELCLFDSPDAAAESARLELPGRTGAVRHGYLPGARPGLLYGYRVHGPYDPRAGHRFNAAKVLLDPYAKGIGREPRWNDALLGERRRDGAQEPEPDDRDDAAWAPLGIVVDPSCDWGDDRPPARSWSETLIYETHVRGFTRLHPDLEPELRGTYRGVASEPAVRHLKSLGVTAVELLPVHQHFRERHLAERGLPNYWGYSTLSYFAPDLQYATPGAGAAGALREFRAMVRGLHAAGIEVILDVVYNHTCEGNARGPTLSWRGIENAAYYRLDAADRRRYADVTGTGNTLDSRHPFTRRLILDSLRYWVTEMRVDGFRFDIAAALGRDPHDVNPAAAFFEDVRRDPVVSRVKLIAEPWDAGPGGYQVGGFPPGWSEWNGRYRDAVRRFWKGEAGAVPELATRLAGSADLYDGTDGRGPRAGINYVTSHDGFTLRDLVTYDAKHNEANLEKNADGEERNLSWNGSVEGPAADPAILAMRERRMRSLVATLLVSQGVPMIRGGDEMGQTQAGNNNAYCQDGPLTWTPWDRSGAAGRLLEFVRRAARIRAEHPILRSERFLHGDLVHAPGDAEAAEADHGPLRDLTWFAPSGAEMSAAEWRDPNLRALGVRLARRRESDGTEGGRHEVLFVMLNGGDQTTPFRMPANRVATWDVLLDTSRDEEPDAASGSEAAGAPVASVESGAVYPLEARSVALFRGIGP
ncbi:MAG TPA: glycogen debranching protein GlgX [Acidobacteriota bacterium]|nr:glycogen debranching protein GlgX [Acidobacteriota bacterium]